MSENERKLKIGVVGSGSMGRTLSLCLTNAGYDVEMTTKLIDDMVIDNMVNVEICGAFGEKSVLVPYVLSNKFTSQKDIIFIMTKSFKVKDALTDTLQYLKEDGIVVGIQNVLNLEEFFSVIPSSRYVSLVADWSAFRYVDRKLVIINHDGLNHIGVLNPKAKVFLPIVKKLMDTVAETVVEDDMLDFIWSKFILTSMTSSLGALTGYNLAHILNTKEGKKLYLNLIKEEIIVAEAMLKHRVSGYNFAFDYYKFVEESVSGLLYRSTMFRRLINQNHNTVSSVLRHLENNRPTELDCIIKRVVKIAKENNLVVPYCTQLAIVLDEIACGERSIIMDNINDDRLKNPMKYM